MKHLLAVLMLISLHPPDSHANGLCANNPDFRFENRDTTVTVPKIRTWNLDELPREVLELLRKNDFFLGLQETEAEKPSGFQFDLNGDTNLEYLIAVPAWSGSGGISYIILSLLNGKWTDIGAANGGFIPLTTGTRIEQTFWRDFGTLWKYGYDNYVYRTNHFVNGKYVEGQAVSCEDGKIKK